MVQNPAIKKAVLKDKEILAVDDERDVLEVLGEELEDYGAILDTALSYEEALQKISSFTYDLAILDIMGVRGFDLLSLAVRKNIPVVILTAHAVSPETLRKSIELGARAYLLKHHLGQVAPFLEDVFNLSYQSLWRKNFEKLAGHFGRTFGTRWRKSEDDFWTKVEHDLELKDSTIILK